VLHAAQRACRPFNWDGVTRESTLTPAQAVFLQDCRALGVHSGLTIPLHAPGQRMDLISVSLRDAHAVPQERTPFVYGIAVQAWLRYGEFAEPQDDQVGPVLTERELECLTWARDGKTTWETGMILSISERTVEYHLVNAAKKLGASNRLMAIVVAIQRGLLPL
jgi:DNA-binding CsgD family transcriptional regulator